MSRTMTWRSMNEKMYAIMHSTTTYHA